MKRIAFFLLLAALPLMSFAQILSFPVEYLQRFTPQVATGKDGFVWVVFEHQTQTEATSRIVVAGFDRDLNFLWARQLEGHKLLSSFRLVEQPNGTLTLAVLDGGSQAAIAVMHFNRDGDIVYTRRLTFDYFNLQLGSLSATSDGYVLAGSEYSYPDRIHFMRFRSNGDLIWEKTYFGNLHGLQTVVFPNDHIYQLIATNSSGITHRPKLLHLDASGNLVNAVEYEAGIQPELFNMCRTADQKLVLTGFNSDTSYTNPNFWFLKVNSDGQPLWSFAYECQIKGFRPGRAFQLTADDTGGVFIQSMGSSNSHVLPLFHIDSNGQPTWGKILPTAQLGVGLDRKGAVLYSMGSWRSGTDLSDNSLFLFKMDTSGRFPSCCADSAVMKSVTAYPVQVASLSFQSGNGMGSGALEIETAALALTPKWACRPLEITLDQSVICPDECLSASLKYPVADTLVVNWFFSGATPAKAEGNTPDPACYALPGLFQIRVEVQDKNCIFQAEDSIAVCRPDAIPNAFSPNDDQLNDVFTPLLYFPPVDYLLEIYDRWGHQVFQTKEYQTGWDGRINGLPAAEDVYAWHLHYTLVRNGTSSTQDWKGDVTLLR